MAKTINRTIMNTTATISFVDADAQAFGEASFSFVGNYDEKAVMKEVAKRLAPNEVPLKVLDIAHDSVMYSMTAQEFMLHGTQGLKPTTRTRYVTTHIKSTVATVLVVNKDDEVERLTIDITGMSKAKIRKSVESDGYVFVKVLETETNEEPWYMTEEFFIANATANEV